MAACRAAILEFAGAVTAEHQRVLALEAALASARHMDAELRYLRKHTAERMPGYPRRPAGWACLYASH
jgi:hypothetical protein